VKGQPRLLEDWLQASKLKMTKRRKVVAHRPSTTRLTSFIHVRRHGVVSTIPLTRLLRDSLIRKVLLSLDVLSIL